MLLSGCSFPDLRDSGRDAALPIDTENDAPPDAIDDASIDAVIDSPPMCESTNTCLSADDLGTQSGDTGAGSVMRTGSTSHWFRIRMTEDDSSSTSGRALRLRTTLSVTAGTDFDVFVYVNEASDALECTTADGTGAASGATEIARAEWGEGTFGNGMDDTRTVTIEVRHISGPCDVASPWTLVAEGNK